MFNCPNCKRSIYFINDDSNVIACECNTVLRKERSYGLDQLIKSELKPHAEKIYQYLQPGTTGEWKGKKFTITGRLLMQSNDSSFNYWSIVFDSGPTAFLTEGYGHYSILREKDVRDVPDKGKFDAVRAGEKTKVLDNKPYRLIRKSSYTNIEVEGEVKTPVIKIPFKTYEFFNESLGYLEIHFHDKGDYEVYEVEFLEPEHFKFNNTISQPVAITFNCEKCNNNLKSISAPFVRNIICSNCQAHYDFDFITATFKYQKKANFRNENTSPYIPLGSTGSFNGILFTVIGFARKRETVGEQAYWTEYTMFNPKEGFSYLSEYNGHWTYVKEWPRPPLKSIDGEDYFVENENTFELYNEYSYKVVNAAGEHIYELENTQSTNVREYIYPPQTFIEEIDKTDECWFYGEHISASKVKRTFGLKVAPPVKYGIGSVQPIMNIEPIKLFKVGFVGLLIYIILHAGTSITKRNQSVVNLDYTFSDTVKSISYTSKKFYLDKNKSNLKINLSGGIMNNNWMEVTGSLVNTDNGKSVPFSTGISYYSGMEDGESWSEGSRSTSLLLTNVKKGNYYIDFDGSAGNAGNSETLNVNIVYDVPVHRNLKAIIILLVIAAVVHLIINGYNKNKRWGS